MSISTETGPVETVRLILDDDTNAWSNHGSAPNIIERSEKTEPSVKENRAANGKTALYVWSPDVGSITVPWATAEDFVDDEVVQVDIWVPATASTANALLSDVIDLVIAYFDDNEQATEWIEIVPDNSSDNSAQAFYTGAHVGDSIQVFLKGLRDR